MKNIENRWCLYLCFRSEVIHFQINYAILSSFFPNHLAQTAQSHASLLRPLTTLHAEFPLLHVDTNRNSHW